jgi:WD40 repeat protein
VLSSSETQEPKPSPAPQKDERGLGIRPDAPAVTTAPQSTHAAKPEIVLQAGISSPQTQISFSPDGRLLASMGMSGNAIKLWEVSTGRLLRQLESSIPSMGASSMSRPFRFSPDGKTITALAEGRVRRWDVETGRELSNTLIASAKNSFLAFLSDDARTMAAANMNSSAITVWDTTSGRELRTFAFQKDENLNTQDAVALSADGKFLASLTDTVKGSMKGLETKVEISLWEVSSGRKIQTLKVKTSSSGFGANATPSASLAFTPDGAWIAVRDDSSLKIWDVASGRELKTLATPVVSTAANDPFVWFASKFRFSNDHRLLSLINEGSKINLVDSTSGATLRTLSDGDATILGTSFSTEGQLLATSGTDNQIRIWDVNSGRVVKKLSGAAMPIDDLAFSSDGKSLVLAGPQAVSLWELTSGGVRLAL